MDLLNKEISKIKRYINLLENYETTPWELSDPVVSKVSYPVMEYFDEVDSTTPYGSDSGVITPKFIKEEMKFISQVASDNGIDISKYSPEQIKKGLDDEADHGKKGSKYDITHDDLLMTLKIVLAHLDENPNYYTELSKIEETKSPVEDDKYEDQVKIQKILNIITSDIPELKQLLQILYTNGIYIKLLKLRSGKFFDLKENILKDLYSYIEKLELPDNEDKKIELVNIIKSMVGDMNEINYPLNEQLRKIKQFMGLIKENDVSSEVDEIENTMGTLEEKKKKKKKKKDPNKEIEMVANAVLKNSKNDVIKKLAQKLLNK